MLPVFGAILIVSGVKVVRHRDKEGTQGHDRAVRLLGRFIPVRATMSGQRFVLREHGKLVATPLLAALVVIEVTDVVFAVDSVPAILAVSREPFLVFASNAFAILGLRAMYFLLGDARERFHYLSHALGRDPRVRRREDGALALVAHPDHGVARGHRRHRDRGHPVQRTETQSYATCVNRGRIAPTADAGSLSNVSRTPTSARRCRARWVAARLLARS